MNNSILIQHFILFNPNSSHIMFFSLRFHQMSLIFFIWFSCRYSIPLAVLSLHVYIPLSSSCTELSSSRHFLPSKCILQLSNAGCISFPLASQSTSVSFGPMTWHSNKTVSPAFAVMSLTGRMTVRLGSTADADCNDRESVTDHNEWASPCHEEFSHNTANHKSYKTSKRTGRCPHG